MWKEMQSVWVSVVFVILIEMSSGTYEMIATAVHH